MEGVASEAASLAGHLALDNLCWIYDNNRITIEGSTRLAFTEDVAGRFVSYGWNVQRVDDANDMERLARALEVFQGTKGRPTLVIVDSHIGYGSPHKHDTAEAHGEPLGDEEVRLAKRFYGWPENAKFLVPDGVYEHFTAGVGARGATARRRWMDLFEAYRAQYGALANEIDLMQRRELPVDWDKNLPVFPADPKGVAGRDASGKVLNVLAQNVPWFLGGSADLAPSNRTTLTYEGAGDFQAESPTGKNLHFGIREHAMAATVNGLALSKLRAFGATFLIFSDYARPAIRLSAVMELPTIFVFTHDAMGDGEDGPTHQPVEQLASLRAIPGLITLRPGDANEVVEAYRYVMQRRHEPAVLALSRQPLPTLDRNKYAPASGLARGAYILGDAPTGKPEVILIASGSEVSLAVEAHEQLLADGIRSRVVSLPSWDIFEHQTQEYRDSVLPPSVTARVAVELLHFEGVDDTEPSRAIRLDPGVHRTYFYWHVFVPGVRPEQLYGYRVEGPFDPETGMRFDPTKVLLDPYGRGVAVPEGYSRDAAQREGDNAATAMKSVVVDPGAYDWEGDAPLRRPSAQTIVYEMHVRGFTRHPSSGVPEKTRGTFAGLIEKIPYLRDLGITAVELLPIFQFDAQDSPLGLVNYWGYSPVSFFAPHQAYSSRQDPLG